MITALDTETVPPDVYEPVPRLVVVAIAGELGRGLYHHTDPRARDVAAACYDHGCTLAMGAFDALAILRRWPELLGNVVAAYARGGVFDVLTRAKLLDVALGRHVKKHGLGDVAARWGGVTLDKADPWRRRYGELLDVPVEHWPEAARHYAQADADGTLAAHHGQAREAAAYSPNPLSTEIVHVRAQLALYSQTVIGFRTDPVAVAKLERQLRGWQEDLTRACLEHGLCRIEGVRVRRIKATPAAAQRMMAAHCAARGLEVPTTDGGAVSIAEDDLRKAGIPLDGVLERKADTPEGVPVLLRDGRFLGHPLNAYRLRGTIQKQLNGRVAAMGRPVVRTRYNELVNTGRTSATAPNRKLPAKTPWHEWCGIQGQNFPRDGGFRECLVPDPGCMLLTTDISGAELAALAAVQRVLFGRSALGDAIDAGQDVHARFGMRVLGLPPEAYDPKIPEHKKARQAAKPWNFGKPGGLGAQRFQDFARSSYGVFFELHEIRRLGRLWLEEWPEMRDYFAWIESHDTGGHLTIVHPIVPFVRGGMRYTEACNFPFQSLAAFVAKEQLWRLWLAQIDPTSPLVGCPQKLFVHDEHVTQVSHGDPARCPEHTGPSCKRCKYTAERLGPGWIFPRVEAAKAEQERIMNSAAHSVAPQVTWRCESALTWRYEKG